jgi:hypothetical protein
MELAISDAQDAYVRGEYTQARAAAETIASSTDRAWRVI